MLGEIVHVIKIQQKILNSWLPIQLRDSPIERWDRVNFQFSIVDLARGPALTSLSLESEAVTSPER